MIRWLHEHERIGIARQQPKRGGCDGRAGVAAHGFEQDAKRPQADLVKLLGDQEAMLFVADQKGRRKSNVAVVSGRGLLEERPLRDKRMQLLGKGRTRQGPKLRSGTARQDHRMNLRRALLVEFRGIGDRVHTRLRSGVDSRRRKLGSVRLSNQ